jgi:hypothetical protein
LTLTRIFRSAVHVIHSGMPTVLDQRADFQQEVSR